MLRSILFLLFLYLGGFLAVGQNNYLSDTLDKDIFICSPEGKASIISSPINNVLDASLLAVGVTFGVILLPVVGMVIAVDAIFYARTPAKFHLQNECISITPHRKSNRWMLREFCFSQVDSVQIRENKHFIETRFYMNEKFVWQLPLKKNLKSFVYRFRFNHSDVAYVNAIVSAIQEKKESEY